MPYSDYEKGLEVRREWTRRALAAGYGKALYARRAQRFRNEQILRAAVEEAAMAETLGEVRTILAQALIDAPEAGSPKEYMPGEPDVIASGLK